MAMYGGSGVSYLFRVTNDHSVIKQLDGTTAATALAHASLKIGRGESRKDILVQTDYTYNDDGTLNVKWNQTKNDAAINSFFDTACPRKLGASTSGIQELVSENGYKVGGDSGSSSDANWLLLSYGAVDSDGKVPVTISIGIILKTSGSYSMSNNNWNTPTLEFKSVACLATDGLTIPATLFDDDIVETETGWSAIELDKDYYSKVFSIAKAAA